MKRRFSVVAALVALAALVGAWAPRRLARASVVDWLAGPSGALPSYLHDVRGRERPRRLELNGVPLAVAAGWTADPPGAVRRFYDQALSDARHGSQLAFGDDERGGLCAIDFGVAPSTTELGARFGKLAASGDLGALGQLQVVLWERGAGGGTRYLDLWSLGAMPVDQLAPPDGDVAGGDLDGMPRPLDATRVLAAGEAGQPQRLRVYRVHAASIVALRELYLTALRARGWTADQAFDRFAGARGRNGLRFGRPGRELYLDFTRSGDEVDVVAIELGR